ncbi:transposase [Burkholderiaceae bacterium 16]|nr:transposase [Burkholderiaceae bacterium 16]
MFVKVTSSGSRRYVQLVESYRDDNGQPKQRTVATLGRLDQLGDSMEGVINGLLRVTGRPALEAAAEPAVTFESARALGDVWALSELWQELGFDGMRRVFRRTRHAIDVEALVRIMVFNRLCDPESKLGLRAMDALVAHQADVDAVLAGLLRPLVDQTLSVVFYDMTTIRAEGLSQQEDDVRQYGMAKEGVIARQFMLGVVQTAEGLPLYHEVFNGNTAEVTTLKPTIEKVLSRFPVRRVIVVADRGLLSIDNLAEMQAMTLPDGAPLEFILAVPGRRYSDVVESLDALHTQQCLPASEEVLGDVPWNGLRLIVAHDPVVAQEKGAQRDTQIAELEQLAAQWVGKLDAQDTGHRSRGKKLSDGGARARFYHAVCEAHLARIIQVDLKSERFCYDINERALQHARMMDGKLLLVTNAADLSPREVVDRYKSLADIERGFRVLKSEIEIGPVYHRLPDRIRAHAAICFMALILYRLMRMRLQAANSELSPARALAMLNRIQHHHIVIDQTKSVAGLSTISQEQARVLSALKVRKPTQKTQLTLL